MELEQLPAPAAMQQLLLLLQQTASHAPTLYDHLSRFVSLEATEANNPVRQACLEAIVEPVRDGSTPLQTLVLALGPSLTSADEQVRERATVALAHAVASSPPLPLESAVNVAGFFSSRLESDQQSALPCLRGLLALLEGHALSDEAVRAAYAAALGSTPVQAWPQPMRAAAFRIGVLALARHASALPAESAAEVFREAMAGEKDPRCLVICLDGLRLLLADERLGGRRLCEAVFDAVAAYFPVAFYPPPGDAHGITHEAVADAVNAVFAAHADMSDFVLPLLIEKLAIDSEDAAPARLEALRALVTVVPAYGPLGISPFLDGVRAALASHVLRHDEADAALLAVRCVVRELSPLAETDATNELWADFTLALLRDAAVTLAGAMDAMTSRASARAAVAVARASVQGQTAALAALAPLLCARLANEPSAAARSAGLELLLGVVESVVPGVRVSGQEPLAPYREAIGNVADALLAAQLAAGLHGRPQETMEARLCVRLLGLVGRDSPRVQEALEDALAATSTAATAATSGTRALVVACVLALRSLGPRAECSLEAAVALSVMPEMCALAVPRLLRAGDASGLRRVLRVAPADALERALVDNEAQLASMAELDTSLLGELNKRVSPAANERLTRARGDCAAVLLTARKVDLASMLPLAMRMPAVVACSLVNKADASPALDEAARQLAERGEAPGLLFKALAMRRHALADELGALLVRAEPMAIARALEDGPEGLDRASFARQSPVFKQRLVDAYLPLLPPAAVALMVARAPPALLHGKPVVAPVVLAASQSLQHAADVLDALHALAVCDVRALEPHLKPLVDFLLAASKAGGVHERERAVDVLAQLAGLEYHVVHPYRATVLRGLAAALDDPRRSVRARAVKVRERWAVFAA